MANAENRSAAANAQKWQSAVDDAAIQIDAVMHAMRDIAAVIDSPTDYILWSMAQALEGSLRLLNQAGPLFSEVQP